MADRLRVTELDFDAIKQNLKNFLKQQSEFTDYDFDGAGLSILLDILAYNTHYNAYYLNMVANESFLDTALLRDSVVSHAKTLGYTPYSTRAPVAIINFTIDSTTTTPATATLPEGYAFLSNQIDSKAYNFVVLNDTTVTKSNTQFFFENLQIFEGQLITYSFIYDQGSNPKQVFTLPDTNIDTTTIKVVVNPSSSNTATATYTKVTDVLDISSTSEVFFLQEERGGNFQIYFGNDVVGKALPDGAIVSVTYLVTAGTEANKANNFVATATVVDSLNNGLSDFTITPVSAASGGADRESVDNIKFSAAARFSTQNRLVTFKDYETYILNNYPNIDSISVWGGEENEPPIYGKVLISMKPKENYYISEAEKRRIIDEIIKPKAIIAVQAEILDPEFLFILVDVEAQYDARKTTNTEAILKERIRNAIINYSNTFLNKFASKIIDSKLETAIDSVDTNAIIGNEIEIKVQKRFEPELNTPQSYNIKFNVPLHRGTVADRFSSTEFDIVDSDGIRRSVVFEEVPQSFTGISSVQVTNPGTGYTSTPTVTITGDGIGATAEAVVVNGTIQSISVTNRGIDYTRAIATISGGFGFGAEASVIIDAAVGSLRTIYYDTNAQRQIVDSSAGTINYNTGEVNIDDINILSVSSTDGLIRLTIEADEGIIESARNTIITVDETDPVSIVVNLTKVS
jgi:hypothetical protein